MKRWQRVAAWVGIIAIITWQQRHPSDWPSVAAVAGCAVLLVYMAAIDAHARQMQHREQRALRALRRVERRGPFRL